ncbi:hypothetical protein NP493_194g06042 [Ridgeia piscesae]|uniref:Uncharacterized protein n=1 Tax=Ridgeia piscesae TaxID=27915 RepID=A0AAD9P232_RIDPI|nr:hypothetical protein NP493_194g06042 [Ridgeia piscesae]
MSLLIATTELPSVTSCVIYNDDNDTLRSLGVAQVHKTQNDVQDRLQKTLPVHVYMKRRPHLFDIIYL